MTAHAWEQLAAIVAIVAIAAPPLGFYLARVFGDGPAPGDRIFGPVERAIYRIVGVDPDHEQRWNVYAMSLLAFSVASVVVLYAMQRLQGHLPLDPTGAHSIDPALSFNTAVSFVTNTNWQNYAGESTMSIFTSMVGLAVQNFVSAAVGITVAIALVRGLTRDGARTIGNFWVDLIRATTRVLLPIALVAAIVFVSQGVIQTFAAPVHAHTITGATQVIPGGPVASQESIKMLGTNGGGYFGANSAHPFENPNGVTNLLQIVLMLLIPFALTFTFGRLAKDRRQGFVLAAAMFLIWFAAAFALTSFESAGNPRLTSRGVDQSMSVGRVGGNMEGKETRFGAAGSGLFGATSTGTSTGAVNASHDSFTAAGGAVPLVAMMLGEISPGGVGAGLYGILIFALLAVFIAGLMVGRTPEYLGKKIQAAEMKLVVLYILVTPLVILAFTALSVAFAGPRSAILNHGPHGLTEVTYAFTSAANNNGSAFGGLSTNTTWYNTTLGIAMLLGRFMLIIPVLAIAGSLARKKRVPVNAGTFPTGTPLFTGLLVGVIVIMVGLTFFPVLALGPIVERLGG
ncbi:MAG: potassium-transporting ATPase subunit KdpA [Actinobacteria bacterium]|nr:potassium-transporting ATPase subunit KdpA [Actinomycetota bacterium]